MTPDYLLEKSRHLVRAFVRKHVANLEDRDDIEQQISLAAIRAHHKVTRQNLRPYMYGICRNTVHSYYRDRKANAMRFGGTVEGLAGDAEEEFELLWQQERREILDEAVDGLPARYRSVVMIYLYQEQNLKRIAEILELNHATTRWRFYRALQLLREQVKMRTTRKE